jgi:hypothetical protein
MTRNPNSSPAGQDGALRLPAAVVQQMLEPVDELAEHAHAMVGPLLADKDRLKEVMHNHGVIRPIGDDDVGDSIACVDGAQVTANLYLGDLVSACAVAAEGLRTDRPGSARASRQWSKFVRHDPDVDGLGKAAMAALEVHLLAGLDHDVAIIDGSHMTFVIAFNAVLSSLSTTAQEQFVELADDLDLVDALTKVCDDQDGAHVVACPKSDSSTAFAEYVAGTCGIDVGTNDKMLATIVLDEGEMLAPMRPSASQWGKLHIGAREHAAPATIALAKALNDAIAPLRDTQVDGRGIGLTYVRPERSQTVVKVEFKRSQGRDHGPRLARSLCHDIHPPFVMEPFSQFLADGWAKSISDAARAQQSAVTNKFVGLSDTAPEAVEYLIRRYRTGT